MIYSFYMVHISLLYLEEGGDACGGPDSPVEVNIVRVVPSRHPVIEATLTPVEIVMVVVMLTRGLRGILEVRDPWARVHRGLRCC